MNAEQAAALRQPFSASAIGKLPRAGIQLDYVGHAAVTDRLLQVDPSWTWEPLALAANGTPLFTVDGGDAVMWIRLTVCDVTRLGVGIVKSTAFELEKQLISDAIRNAAMRFGVALDLWSKEDLAHASEASATAQRVQPSGETEPPSVSPLTQDRPIFPPAPAVSKRRREKAKARCVALQSDGVSIADEREKRGHLPLVDSCNAEQMTAFEQMLDDLEAALEKPFVDAPS